MNNIVQNDLNIFDKIKGNKILQDQELEYLRPKFTTNIIFQYKIYTFILIRYLIDIENNLRYPTAKNNYSFDNYINNKNLKFLKILIQFNKELLEIIQYLRTNLWVVTEVTYDIRYNNSITFVLFNLDNLQSYKEIVQII